MEIKETKQQMPSQKPLAIKGIMVMVLFIFMVWIIWQFSSGMRESLLSNKASTTTAVITKPKPLEISFYNTWIKITSTVTVRETYPEKEYIELKVLQPNLSGVDVTNWTLSNTTGGTAKLGQGSSLPILGKVNPLEPLNIKAGDRVIVSTGRSPIGVSFRLNACSAYLEQFQDFIPPITGRCPQVTSADTFSSLDNDCRYFIQSIPQCEANTRTLPSNITSSCKKFIDTAVNYNGCVALHKDDPDFYQNEWRVFLGQEKEFWAPAKETITLLDEKGKLVDTVKY